VDKKKGLVV